MEKTSILLVEDEFIIAKDIEKTLVKTGYSVLGIVMSGEDCLEFLENNKPDMILMDIKLQGELDGIETSNIVQSRYGIPVIYLTAHSDRDSLERAKYTMPYGYIIKPINERELFTIIETSMYRYRTDKRMRKNDIKYRILFEQSGDAIYLRNKEGIISEMNQSMIDLFGYQKEELCGMHVRELFVNPEQFSEVSEIIETSGFVKNHEVVFKKKDGSEMTCIASSTKFFDEVEDVSGYQVIVRDITEEKKNLDKLMKTRQELRFLSAHLQALREMERSNIAREIHDVLGQLLTALKMDCSWILKKVDDDGAEVKQKKETVLNLIDDTIDEVGRISSELRPGLLYDLGLCEALEWQASEFIKRTGIPCEIYCDIDDENLSDHQSIALFRIFQESLTNIIRHAEATEVEVSCVENDDRFELKILDNGKGIPEGKINDVQSFGLIGMRERAYSCDGEIAITNINTGGTLVFVSIPRAPSDMAEKE